jgi:hypothetical protein
MGASGVGFGEVDAAGFAAGVPRGFAGVAAVLGAGVKKGCFAGVAGFRGSGVSLGAAETGVTAMLEATIVIAAHASGFIIILLRTL